MKKSIFFILLVLIFISRGERIYGQKKLILQGKIFSAIDNQPLEMAVIILKELKKKVYCDENGVYRIENINPGRYTIIVISDRFKRLESVVDIKKNLKKSFFLEPLTVQGGTIKIIDDRYVQKISRRTMTGEQMKSTPASFGDAVSAMTALPGVNRTQGFLGPLAIRGMHSGKNMYFVDGIPISSPLHFGGFHSVVNTNIIDRVDLYASAFPVQYGNAISSIIDIQTIDNVEKTSSIADISVLSANALFMSPITRQVVGPGGVKTENAGYTMGSGRYGYIGQVVKYITAEGDLEVAPIYYDYQLKGKYFVDENNSFTLLFLGGSDRFKMISSKTESKLSEGDDPYTNDLKLIINERYNNLGLNYTYERSFLRNKLLGYGSWTKRSSDINSNYEDAADWAKDYKLELSPHIYGIKNTTNLEWWENHAELKLNLEYTLYYFKANGMVLAQNKDSFEGGPPNLADPDLYLIEEIDFKVKNHVFTGFAENRFNIEGLTFIPGIRSDYLSRTEHATLDPRVMVSYEFTSETTISAASGKYSAFIQTNPETFKDERPDFAEIDYLDPEIAYHNTVGIEQKIDMFTIGMEGYYNRFKDLVFEYPHYNADGDYRKALNSGKGYAYGFEIMLRKDKEKGIDGIFGWLNYTYCRSREKTGITGNRFDEEGNDTGELFDPNGSKWYTNENERRHSLKIILGYTLGKHTISGKFQYYTSLPYTPIIGSEENPVGSGRYEPVMSDKDNSKHFAANHRLDLRYTYKTIYSWGYISLYIEVLNVYWSKPVVEEEWLYNKPYKKGSNPEHTSGGETLEDIPIPNFGVEIRF